MKLNELTKEQRSSIESDELGRITLNALKLSQVKKLDVEFYKIIYKGHIQEIKRTIKRIYDEIEFLDRVEDNLTTNFATCDMYGDIYARLIRLKQQKELYELMEQLE